MNRILSEVERLIAQQRRTPCYCSAYNFPHRVGGGNCHEKMPVEPRGLHYRGEERDLDLRLFDREEARAINQQRERMNAL